MLQICNLTIAKPRKTVLFHRGSSPDDWKKGNTIQVLKKL